jgi:hypothetical protein
MKRLILLITVLSLILPVISKAEEFTGWWKNLYDLLITPEATSNEAILKMLNEYYKEYIDREKDINAKADALSKAILEGNEKKALVITGDISKIRYALEKTKVKAMIKLLPLMNDTQKEFLKGLIIPAYPTKIDEAVPEKIEK